MSNGGRDGERKGGSDGGWKGERKERGRIKRESEENAILVQKYCMHVI